MKTTLLALMAVFALSAPGARADDADGSMSGTKQVDSTKTTTENPDGSKTTTKHTKKRMHKKTSAGSGDESSGGGSGASQ